MSLWELRTVLVHQWKIFLVGALCTAIVGLAAISDDGVYFSRTDLVFLAPASSTYPNALRTQSEDVIDTAGIVAKRLSGPGQVSKYASPDVTLIGLGVRDGWSLQLPDTGGQWATNFANQRLVLDIVAPSSAQVQERQRYLIDRVQQELYQLQRDAGVNPVNDITAIPAPESTTVYHVGGNHYRALGMTGALGLAATIAAVMIDVRRRRFTTPLVVPVGSRSLVVAGR